MAFWCGARLVPLLEPLGQGRPPQGHLQTQGSQSPRARPPQLGVLKAGCLAGAGGVQMHPCGLTGP